MKFKKILCPELNSGQLAKILQSNFLIEIDSFTKIQGLPFKTSEIENKIESMIGGNGDGKK